jgi:hypothetical protein
LAGKSELSIILCISNGSENYCDGFPEGVQKIVDIYQLSPFAAKVSILILEENYHRYLIDLSFPAIRSSWMDILQSITMTCATHTKVVVDGCHCFVYSRLVIFNQMHNAVPLYGKMLENIYFYVVI